MGDNKEIVRILQEHHEIHEGHAFHCGNDQVTMATTETINFAFKTPPAATKLIHMVVEFTTKAGGLMEMLEAATWTKQTGTVLVPKNNDRNSNNKSTLLGNETTSTFTANEIAYDVTTVLTTNATTCCQSRVFGSNKDAGSSRARVEQILKADTTYVIRFTADGNTNGCFLKLAWYEHLPNVI